MIFFDIKEPLSTGMLWVDQRYHNAILECQQQENSLKLIAEEPPVQNKYIQSHCRNKPNTNTSPHYTF